MNLFSINSAANYAKFKELEFKWQKKKENPLLAKETNQVKEDPQIAAFKEQWRQQQEAQATASIVGKLKAGVPLSADEMEYLKTNAPQEYEKAVQVQKEREQYKRELASCRSKEDVEKLSQRKLSQFCTEANAIAKNPNIPDDKKRERLEVIGMRLMAVMDEHYSFKETQEYKRLPDKNEEEKETAAAVAAEEKKLDIQEAETEDPLQKLGELLGDVLWPLEEEGAPAVPAQTKTAAAPPTAQVYNAHGQKSRVELTSKDISIDV